jgi:uracil-DNA glycosylase
VRVVVVLGSIAFKSYFAARKELGWTNPAPLPSFQHSGFVTMEEGTRVISSYHPSQQNTQTGKLTEKMFDDIFQRARKEIERA